jgi:hypothetical protein
MTTKMTAIDLDHSYTALCHALNEVGEANAQPFLAMLSLSLMARADNAAQVLGLIENARTQATRIPQQTPPTRTPAILVPQ